MIRNQQVRISVLRNARPTVYSGSSSGIAVMTGNLLNTPHGMYQTPNFVNQESLPLSLTFISFRAPLAPGTVASARVRQMNRIKI